MLPIIQIGPFSVQAAGLVILLGLWLGLGRVEKHASRYAMKPAELETMVMLTLGIGLIGARIGYVASNPTMLSSGWLAILSPRPEMLEPLTGILSGVAAGVIYGRKHQFELWATLDSLTPGAALFMAFLALSHFLSGNAYGMPTSLPWSIQLYGTSRHPSQMYELVAATGIYLWVERQLRVHSDRQSSPGVLVLKFLAGSLGARVLLETFRGDSTIIAGNVRLEQLAALGLFAACLWLLEKRERYSMLDKNNRS
ncbi:MAG: hypothetical protein HPY76_08735 [Anaerolineae bacterium]|nr:hypothetical protein [Anaerolineae bacterium]